ncbi:MAG: hypothetical protein V3W19_15760, partial [Desulfatiglandales bacterium]
MPVESLKVERLAIPVDIKPKDVNKRVTSSLKSTPLMTGSSTFQYSTPARAGIFDIPLFHVRGKKLKLQKSP